MARPCRLLETANPRKRGDAKPVPYPGRTGRVERLTKGLTYERDQRRPRRPQISRLPARAPLIVLAIIPVLALIGVPHFTNFMHRTRRTEAYLGLNGVLIAQSTFYPEVGRFASSFDEVGFEILGGTRQRPSTGPSTASRRILMSSMGCRMGSTEPRLREISSQKTPS